MSLRNTAFLSLIMLAFTTSACAERGHLVVIGGGDRPASVMEPFIELAGGDQGYIVVIPYASGDPKDVAEYQVNQMLEHGIGRAAYVLGDTASIDSPDQLALLDGATGIFLSGGDQRRLTRLLLGTRMLEAIRDIYHNGGVIAGTSAGAAVMSPLMITGDEALYPEAEYPFETIQAKNVIVTEGFGFLPGTIVDQHFHRRQRQNRLISKTLEHPELIGIGIDEATAILVKPDLNFSVIGESTVQIYDASAAEILTRPTDKRLHATGVKVHILLAEDRYLLKKKQPKLSQP